MAKKPAVEADIIIKTGMKALELGRKKRRSIEPRLPAGMLDGLEADIEAFREARVAVKTKGPEIRAATGTVDAVVQRTLNLCKAIRKSVTDAGAPREVRAGWGLGTVQLRSNVSRCRAAAETIIKRVNDFPEEARSFGILDKDIDKLKALSKRLIDVDTQQDQLITTQGDVTRERNATSRRIIRAVKRISSAGALEYENKPATAAEFLALAAPVTKSKSKTNTGTSSGTNSGTNPATNSGTTPTMSTPTPDGEEAA